MRRFLSILLTLVLGLGPAAVAIPANALAFGWGARLDDSDESRLPACCRRNGAHHCTMKLAERQAMGDDDGTSLSESSSCPHMPNAIASNLRQSHALLANSTGLKLLLAERRTPQASEADARISARRGWPKRGPPSRIVL